MTGTFSEFHLDIITITITAEEHYIVRMPGKRFAYLVPFLFRRLWPPSISSDCDRFIILVPGKNSWFNLCPFRFAVCDRHLSPRIVIVLSYWYQVKTLGLIYALSVSPSVTTIYLLG